MKKKRLCLYCIIFVVFCQLVTTVGLTRTVVAENEKPVLTDAERSVIVDHCDTIRDNLKFTQREDSRTRVYLGRYYETILSKFITPLNLRLVENTLSDTKLINNQTSFAAERAEFMSDFVMYSQALEELTKINCKTEPNLFYEKLEITRTLRKVVNRDAKKMRELTHEQVKLVEQLRESLK